jgi:hypothetical protein
MAALHTGVAGLRFGDSDEAIQATADTGTLHSLFVVRNGYEIVNVDVYP